MIYIVVPTFNRVEICNQFIEYLNQQVFNGYTLVLVDHGQKKTGIKDSEKIKVIFSDVNGWAKAVNVGLRYVLNQDLQDDDCVLIINDDVVLREDYLKKVNDIVKEKPKSIVGSCCIDKRNNKILRASIVLNKYKALYIYHYQGLDASVLSSDYIESDVLTGKGTIIPINILKEIGIYEEEKLPHYKADHELVLRAKKRGFDVIVAPELKVYTLSDQREPKADDTIKDLFKFFYFDMLSTIRIKDWWYFAILSYPFSYAIYFFLINFIRNTMGMLYMYWKRRRKKCCFWA